MDGSAMDPEDMARTLSEYRDLTTALRRTPPETDEWRDLERRVAELEAEIRSWPLRHGDRPS